jgi:cell wall-associated NlpC family hydrolase
MHIVSPVPNHVAIYIGDNKILHHVQGRLSSRDVYGSYYQKVTAKILRHENH